MLDRKAMCCNRCGGPMFFEKFYDVNDSFCGWRCPMCGEILDPVILLHRLARSPNLEIPENQEGVMKLIKKYLKAEISPAAVPA